MNPNDHSDDSRLNNSNNNKLSSVEILVRVCAIMLAMAIILFSFAYTQMDRGMPKTVLYISAGLFGIISTFVLVVVAIGTYYEKHPMNFFLYDSRTKQNLLPSQLTVREIRRRIVGYISSFKINGSLCVGELFRTRGVPEEFKPLFCYELLFQIAEDSSSKKAGIFLSYGSDCSDAFMKYLSQSEDHEIACRIRDFMLNFSGENEIARDFTNYLSSKKWHLEQKMLNYTLQNIDKF